MQRKNAEPNQEIVSGVGEQSTKLKKPRLSKTKKAVIVAALSEDGVLLGDEFNSQTDMAAVINAANDETVTAEAVRRVVGEKQKLEATQVKKDAAAAKKARFENMQRLQANEEQIASKDRELRVAEMTACTVFHGELVKKI